MTTRKTATGGVTGMTLAERRKAEQAMKGSKIVSATITELRKSQAATKRTAKTAAVAPAPTGDDMTCRVCARVRPVTKFPTKAPKDGVVTRDDRCRECRDAAKVAR